jgi:hypothetical protein
MGTVVLLVGGVAAYFASKFADKFAVPLIAAWCGGIITFLLIGPTKIPGGAKLAILVLVAVITAYFSYKDTVQRYVKSVGTALIGSFILFYGIGRYVGGYPQIISTQSGSGGSIEDIAIDNLNSQMGTMALFYLGGTVLVAVLGTWVQLTYVVKEKEDEDDFMNSKNA